MSHHSLLGGEVYWCFPFVLQPIGRRLQGIQSHSSANVTLPRSPPAEPCSAHTLPRGHSPRTPLPSVHHTAASPAAGSPHGFFLAGGTDGPVLPSVPTSRPGMEARFSITPHKTPALPGFRRPGKAPPFLTPLGSQPTVPPPSPPPGAKAPKTQPCAGNAASALPWAPRPLPCPLRPTPASYHHM